MRIRFLVFTFFLSQFITSHAQGYWLQLENPTPQGRLGAIAFAINNKGYFGLGVDRTKNYHNDFWEYDPVTDAWTQKANFPGPGRERAIAFSINNKAYIGLGGNLKTCFNDFWEYNPDSNSWKQISDFPGPSRMMASGFTFGKYGYMSLGYFITDTSHSNYIPFYKDLWRFDTDSNSWKQLRDFPGHARAGASSFSLADKDYIGLGTYYSAGQVYAKDLWQYQIQSDTWIQKKDFPGGRGWGGVGFALNGNGYMGMGFFPYSSVEGILWQYDTSDNWTQMATNLDYIPYAGVAFTIGNNAYIGSGLSVSYYFYPDFWEFSLSPLGVSSIVKKNEIGLGPNPTKGTIGIKSAHPILDDIEVYNVMGKKVLEIQSHPPFSNSQIIDISSLSDGVYFVQMGSYRKKIVLTRN